MVDQKMDFEVGDQVVHWNFGLGEIIQLDEKKLDEFSGEYYVVQIRDLKLWVPRDEPGEPCLRFPTPADEFRDLFGLLASAGESLSANRFMRQTELTDILADRTLEAVCRVVRDLVHFKRDHKMNASDSLILKRSRAFLLDEWSHALSVPIQQAERELTDLLKNSEV